MKEVEVAGLFALAQIKILKMWQLPNQYITSRETETDEEILREAVYRFRRPWWLVRTICGCIEIGWRKRVIEIRWDDTPVRKKLVEEQYITSDLTYVHAWSIEKALEYLKLWARAGNALDKLGGGTGSVDGLGGMGQPHCTGHVDFDPESRKPAL